MSDRFARGLLARGLDALRALELDRRASNAAEVAGREGAAITRRGAAWARREARLVLDGAAPVVRAARRGIAARLQRAPIPVPGTVEGLQDELPAGEAAQLEPPRPRRPLREAPLFGDLPGQRAPQSPPLRLPPAEALQAAGPSAADAAGETLGERWRRAWRAERMNGKGMTMAALGGLALGALAMSAAFGSATVTDPGRARMEQVVRDYLLAHPEIIPEAMAKLRERDTAALISSRRAALETPFSGAWAGAEDGDVVLVEFFDYACGYCRTAVKDVDRLLAEDKRLKVVFRELPILGEASDEAARVSLAAAKAGRYLDFHRALFAAGRPSAATLAEIRGRTNLPPAQVNAALQAADVRREIEANIELATALGISGTPSFVVGDQVLGGAVGYEALKKAIATARAGR